jgi:hypothetical protein
MPIFFPSSNVQPVGAICPYHGKLYVGGDIFTYPLDTVGKILCYDGNNWQSLAGGIKGLNSVVLTMAVYHDELYVGGSFLKSNGNHDDNIQK